MKMLRGHRHIDPISQTIINEYMTCKIGFGEMGGVFNWPFGSIAKTPSFWVECFQILDKTLQNYQAAQRKK